MKLARGAILFAVGALAIGWPSASTAQTGTPGRLGTPPAQRRHLFSRPGILRRPVLTRGSIIGNTKTKVYHLPGDTGMLPSAKNRVYFRTEAEAIRAGYHAARRGGRPAPAGRPMRPRDPRTGRFLPSGGHTRP